MRVWPNSIQEINALPVETKEAIYRTLLPEWVFTDYQVDQADLTVNGQRVVHFRCPEGSRAVELSVMRHAADLDPLIYLNMADTFNNQLLVLLVVVNDLESPRYNIDVDEHGNRTQLGTMGRNRAAEIAAMQAGLAPGQIHKGLRVFRQLVPVFETFVHNLGHDLFLIEPLAYHNAIVFERYGFGYIRGRQDMERIHQEFQPGGPLQAKLTPENPFRQPDAWQSVRGRAWAIHDNILGHPFTGFQMYKELGKQRGVNTFPDLIW